MIKCSFRTKIFLSRKEPSFRCLAIPHLPCLLFTPPVGFYVSLDQIDFLHKITQTKLSYTIYSRIDYKKILNTYQKNLCNTIKIAENAEITRNLENDTRHICPRNRLHITWILTGPRISKTYRQMSWRFKSIEKY